jgi:hypothetical protein
MRSFEIKGDYLAKDKLKTNRFYVLMNNPSVRNLIFKFRCFVNNKVYDYGAYSYEYDYYDNSDVPTFIFLESVLVRKATREEINEFLTKLKNI